MVQVIPYTNSVGILPPHILVHTYPKPNDKRVRLAIVELREVENESATFTKLVEKQPMSHDDAIKFATKFAQKHGTTVIYEQKDSCTGLLASQHSPVSQKESAMQYDILVLGQQVATYHACSVLDALEHYAQDQGFRDYDELVDKSLNGRREGIWAQVRTPAEPACPPM